MEDLFSSEVKTVTQECEVLGTKIKYDCVPPENCQTAKFVPLVNWNTDNAVILAFDQLLKQESTDTTKVRLIELGSGLGIPSIFFAKNYKLGHLTINDGDETAAAFIQANLAQNAPYLTHDVAVTPFWWFGDSETSGLPHCVQALRNSFDFVIGSDVIYDPVTVESLLFTVKFLMKHNGRCVLTNYFGRFYKNEGAFHSAVKALGMQCQISETGLNNQTVVAVLTAAHSE